MSISGIAKVMAIVGILFLVPQSSRAQAVDKAKLATAKSIRCNFPLSSTGTWKDGQPAASVKPASLVVQFEAINTDEGSAQLNGGFGIYDIIVRFSPGYLNFIQAFRDGPLYVTTVFDKPSSGDKLKAVQSRHEHFDFALPGYTSSPEQYYGECEILN